MRKAKAGGEMFVKGDGQPSDAGIYKAILAEGDDEAERLVSVQVLMRGGMDEAEARALTGRRRSESARPRSLLDQHVVALDTFVIGHIKLMLDGLHHILAQKRAAFSLQGIGSEGIGAALRFVIAKPDHRIIME